VTIAAGKSEDVTFAAGAAASATVEFPDLEGASPQTVPVASGECASPAPSESNPSDSRTPRARAPRRPRRPAPASGQWPAHPRVGQRQPPDHRRRHSRLRRRGGAAAHRSRIVLYLARRQRGRRPRSRSARPSLHRADRPPHHRLRRPIPTHPNSGARPVTHRAPPLFTASEGRHPAWVPQ